jgi:hypothetical protein
MPSAPFDEIALEYARHYANIDYARREYHRQRDDILADLQRSLVEAAARVDLSLHNILPEADKTHRAGPLQRQYHRTVTTKTARERHRPDGVWFGLSTGAVRGEEDTELCSRADLYFGMGSPAYGRLTTTLLELEKHAAAQLAGVPVADEPLRLRYSGGWLFIPIARIPPTADEFTRDRFKTIVAALPGRFMRLAAGT